MGNLFLVLSCFLIPFLFFPTISVQHKFLGISKTSSRNVSNYPGVYFFQQTIDHFSYTPYSYNTFTQMYVINSEYWAGQNSSAPIFVVLGAEAPIDIQTELFKKNAQHFNALLVYIEHRFYGMSNPGGTMEAALENAHLRGYFNSAQTLQDYAEVIMHLKQKLNASTSPVIVVGASYGGMLAAWFRLKYPHVAIGALASSAPILYFDNIIPQDCFYSVVTKDFRKTSENCYNIIRSSWGEIDKIAAQHSGSSILTRHFNLCSPLVNATELKEFLKLLFTGIAQYNPSKPNEDYVKGVCDAIVSGAKNASGDLLDGIYAGVVTALGEKKCYNVNDTFSQVPKETVLGWDWQACSEMVTPIGQTLKDSMFPIEPFNLTSFAKICKRKYNVAPRPHWITAYFGGHDMKSVLERFGSNIIFFNGLKDPYSCGGVLKSMSDTLVALTHGNGSHCQDVDLEDDDDPQWLIELRKKERDIIRSWID